LFLKGQNFWSYLVVLLQKGNGLCPVSTDACWESPGKAVQKKKKAILSIEKANKNSNLC
jgi:hypothetical protein